MQQLLDGEREAFDNEIINIVLAQGVDAQPGSMPFDPWPSQKHSRGR